MKPAEGAPLVAAARVPHIRYVDGLRAIAVLTVLIFHGGEVADGVFPDRFVGFFRGVNLFFTISGFCLAFPFLASWRSGKPFVMDVRAYGNFLLRRFSRIAPPYYIAATVFLVLGFTAFGFPDVGGAVVAPRFAFREYGFDLAFLTPRVPLINVAFWTLGVEARWYLLCPILIGLYVRARPAFYLIGAGLYGLYFLTPYSVADAGTLPCFMLGIVAADAVLGRRPWAKFAWIGAAGCLAVAIWSNGSDFADPRWHAACFFLVVAGSRGVFRRVLVARPLVALGVASFSIYLYHAPIVERLVRAGVARPLAALVALAIGYAAWQLVERQVASQAFRGALEGRLRKVFAWPAIVFGAGARVPRA